MTKTVFFLILVFLWGLLYLAFSFIDTSSLCVKIYTRDISMVMDPDIGTAIGFHSEKQRLASTGDSFEFGDYGSGFIIGQNRQLKNIGICQGEHFIPLSK